MWKQKICVNLTPSFGAEIAELIPMAKRIGFDGFFTAWEHGNIDEYKKIADREGMLYQSVHAPYDRMQQIWKGTDEDAEPAIRELIDCVDVSADNGVGIVICHAAQGDYNIVGDRAKMGKGIARLGRVVAEAEKRGIRVAFENTEGEEYLAALLEEFRSSPAVGYCFDCGHEICYNHSRDLLALYGDRVIATHLNDNLGISRFDGNIYWTDDLHLFPFDGVADWDDIIARLDRCGYRGVLTFEMKKDSKPNRHENDVYMAMTAEQYLTEIYKRACRVAYKRKTLPEL